MAVASDGARCTPGATSPAESRGSASTPWRVALAALLALFAGAAPAAERELRVAAAADLKFALDELAVAFRVARPDVALKVTHGSSGNFFAQLDNQAPFDVFLSADADYPRRLDAAGRGLPDSFFVYGIGRIVLWVPQGSALDLDGLGLRALLDPRVRRVAIANPRHAPYGRAAEAALRHYRLYDAVKPKLVLGENVAQAAQFAWSGAADAGIVALSLAAAPAMGAAGRFVEVPLEAYPRLEQGGLILRWAKDADAARAFRLFLLAEQGRAVLGRYGFLPPPDKP